MILVAILFLQTLLRVDSAAYIVAASNTIESGKKRADIVCNGINDTEILRNSLMYGQLKQIEFYDNDWNVAYAYTGQSVEWLPGDYNLDSTLFLPTISDTVLSAEGAIFHYNSVTGDAIVITGAMRSRLYFGTIYSASNTGAAIAARPSYYTKAGNKDFMPILMNFITFQGLQHNPITSLGGQGFVAQNAFCTNAVVGTDIRGFDIGVWNDPQVGGGTIDTNWYWFSYVRHNMKNILVDDPTDGSVNAQQWFVNVDSMNDGSVSIKTGGKFDWWRIIMGTWNRAPSTRSIILDPNAEGNILEITPSLYMFDGYENNAKYDNNIFNQVPQGVSPVTGKKTHLVNTFSQFIDGDKESGNENVFSSVDLNKKSLSQRLKELMEAYELKLISLEEYNITREKILTQA